MRQTPLGFREVLDLRCRAHCTSCSYLNQPVIRSPRCIAEKFHTVNQQELVW
jgi:hypothetical protein